MSADNSDYVKAQDVDPGEWFICEGVSIESIGSRRNDDEPGYEPRVKMQLHGRWNRGHVAATVTAILSPETAREFAPWLPEAADASERDVVMMNRMERGDL